MLMEDGEEISSDILKLNLNMSGLGNRHYFKSATLSSDGKYVIVLTSNKKIIKFDFHTRKQISTDNLPDNILFSNEIDLKHHDFLLKNLLFLSLENNNIVIKENSSILYRFKDNYKYIQSITICNKNRYMIVVKRHEIKIYDIFNTSLIGEYHDTPIVESMVFTKKSRFLITSTNTGYIHIWDLKSFKLYKQFQAHYKRIPSIDISQNNKYLVTGSTDDYIKIWKIDDILNGEEIKPIKKFNTNRDVGLVFFYKDKIKYKKVDYNKDGKVIEGLKSYQIEIDTNSSKNYQDLQIWYNRFAKIDNEMKKYLRKGAKSIDKNNKSILYGTIDGRSILVDKEKVVLENIYNREEIVSTKISNNGFLVSSDKHGNIYLYNKDNNKLKKILKANDLGDWFVFDDINKRLYRGDYKSYFFKKDSKTLEYLYPLEKLDMNILDMGFSKEIKLVKGRINNFILPINYKKSSLCWIDISLENKYFTIPPFNNFIKR
jgi:WD40 repeat protein